MSDVVKTSTPQGCEGAGACTVCCLLPGSLLTGPEVQWTQLWPQDDDLAPSANIPLNRRASGSRIWGWQSLGMTETPCLRVPALISAPGAGLLAEWGVLPLPFPHLPSPLLGGLGVFTLPHRTCHCGWATLYSGHLCTSRLRN